MHRTFFGVLSACGIVLGLASAATAADRPCLEDAQTLCGDVEPGEGRLRACLESKKDQASAQCRMRMTKMKAELKRGEDACGDDALRLCGDVEPGKGRVAKCLVENEADLTPACQAWTAETRDAVNEAGEKVRGGLQRLKAIAEACEADVAQFCADVPEGKGRRVQCLESNKGQVSDGCRSALE